VISAVLGRSAFLTIAAFAAALMMAPVAHAANATLDGGTFVLKEGEQARFPIRADAGGPSDLHARCRIDDVGGAASLTFDGEYYVPLSDPAVGDVIALSRGDTRDYPLMGVVDPKGREAYIAFNFTGAPAPMCFPGMDCSGAEGASGSVTVTCENTSAP
jgi:hypothetical protein